MTALEGAIQTLKERVKVDRSLRDYVESDFDKFCENECVAIDIVLNCIEKMNVKIKELDHEIKEYEALLRNREETDVDYYTMLGEKVALDILIKLVNGSD